MEATSNYLVTSSHRLEGGVLGPIRFEPEPSWHPFSIGRAVPTMQMYYNDSRGHPGAEGEEESPCSVPMAPELSGLSSWKPQGQDVVLLGLQCVGFLFVCLFLSVSLPPTHVSIIPFGGLGALPCGISSRVLGKHLPNYILGCHILLPFSNYLQKHSLTKICSKGISVII